MRNKNEEQMVKVGMADWNIASSPSLIRTSGLGSCVGIVLYDEWNKLAALAHIMLPDSSMSRTNTVSFNRAKFADTALVDMWKELIKRSSAPPSLKAKLAGGAQMFSFANDLMRIGPRNTEAVKRFLIEYRIPLISEDTGGNKGRTITFYPETSKLHVRTINKGESVI